MQNFLVRNLARVMAEEGMIQSEEKHKQLHNRYD